MVYTFETAYDSKALTAMAKCLRKTVRKKRSRKSHILGWIVVALAVLLTVTSGEEGFSMDFRKIVTWIASAAIVVTFLFEDRLNGLLAGKRMLKGTEKVVAAFDTEKAETFCSETSVGKSEFSYEKICLLAETSGYFVFVFSANHAQVYNKACLTGGTESEFRGFISEKTNKSVIFVK